MSNQPTCEERIDAQLAGRTAQIAAMRELIEYQTGAELSQDALDLLGDRGIEMPEREADEDEIREAGYDEMRELPLGVSSQTVFRIDLSTGGPGDWLEVRCSGDTPAYEGGDGAYEIEGVSYHFNDWFDHAERELHGQELEAAEEFAREVVPELVA